ncbi:hypothetical protein HDE_07430 [Halotydeus destructor]|nr:hypothetical protein HDE_07430 [Halotydeus destructor]
MRDEILRLAQDAINTYSTWRDRANALKAHLDNAYGGRWGVILVRGSNIERVSRYDANPYFKFSIDDVYVDVFQTQLNVEKESKSSLQFPSVKLFG